ncbi:MAG: hypothetical protein KDD47_27870, partial [Acidobacteria bacterium]|nr:hypothetical protein [Acidobacteriota bacterium]
MPKHKLNAAGTSGAVSAPFGALGAGAADQAAFVGVFDIGQGGFNGVFNADGRPFLYFDMGGGIKGLLYTYPDPPPEFCFSSLRLIVQSHFDEDHYKTATLPAFQAHFAPGDLLVIPQHPMGVLGGAAIDALDHGGVDIYFWPVAGLAAIALGGTGIEVIKCGGRGKNHNGLALRIQDPGAANEWVLLPADAHFRRAVFPWDHGGANPDGRMIGIGPTHHGARETDGNIPQALGGAVRAAAYSFGPGNLFGHPFNQAAHARGDGVNSYQNRGYVAGGRLQTAGEPID